MVLHFVIPFLHPLYSSLLFSILIFIQFSKFINFSVFFCILCVVFAIVFVIFFSCYLLNPLFILNSSLYFSFYHLIFLSMAIFMVDFHLFLILPEVCFLLGEFSAIPFLYFCTISRKCNSSILYHTTNLFSYFLCSKEFDLYPNKKII